MGLPVRVHPRLAEGCVASSGIPVVVMGLGDIGQAIARGALARPELRLLGAVDPRPELAGRPLSDVLGMPAPGLPVAAQAAELLRGARGGVVLHATGSHFAEILPQLQEAVR